MAVKILSVDFDWIMEPSINIYNDFGDGRISISQILKNHPGISVKADFEKYKLLNTYLNNVTDKIYEPTRIQFAINHDSIIDCIENVWDLKTEKYDIYNIDHHHDCGYAVRNYEEVEKQGVTCGNWVMYCKNLRKYTWINNKNSNCNIIDDAFNRIPEIQYCSDINLLNFIDFDYVFICLSPGWVPDEYLPLYNVIEDNIVKKFAQVGK